MHVLAPVDDALDVARLGDVDALKSSVMGVINHGADANAARPTGFGSIHWIGSVEPVNALDGDLWTATA